MFYSILLLTLLFGSAEMCGNLVQSNAPSKQSDVGSGEATVKITLDGTNKIKCGDFKTELGATDEAKLFEKYEESCSPKTDAEGALNIIVASGSCDDALEIANLVNTAPTVLKAKLNSATFTCKGVTMNVKKIP